MAIVDILFIILFILLFIVFTKKGYNIGYVMFIGTFIIFIISDINIKDLFYYIFKGIVSENTLMVNIIMFLILILENIMRNKKMIMNIVNNLKELAGSKRIAAIMMPAIIGMLPSPGGARFSCPMVGELLDKKNKGITMAFINYWFRHFWLDRFILYPGVILASKLSGFTVFELFIRMLPFMVIMFVIGTLISLKTVEYEKIESSKRKIELIKGFLINMLPVIIVIIAYILLVNVFEYALEVSLLVVVIAMIVIKKYKKSKIKVLIKSGIKKNLIIIIIGVMAFKEVLLGSGLMEEFTNFISTNEIPIEVVCFLFPFFSGVASGISISFVSLSFPVLMPLGLGDNIWYVVLAFISGFMGVLITPLHLCAVITAEYFKVNLTKMLSKVFFASSIVLVICIIMFTIF